MTAAPPPNPGGSEGMLTLDALRDAVAGDEIDTVVVGFTDHYGRLMGKRFDAGVLPRRRSPTTAPTPATTCSPPTWRWSRSPATGSRTGSRATATSTSCPTWRRCGGRLARPHRARAVRRADARPRARRGRAALDPAPRRSTRPPRPGFTAHGRLRARVLPLRDVVPRRGARAATRDLEPAGWYLEDYHLLQGARTEDFTARGPPPPAPLGRAGRELEGRVGPRPARAERALRRRARDGRPPRRLQAVPQGARRPHGRQRHLHGEAARPTRPARAATSTSSLWRDGDNAFAGDDELGPVRCSDEFRWFLGGWLAHVPDVMVLLRPDGELLQALRRRLVGADPARLELRQPHRRLPRRRRTGRACASSAASRAPTATPTSRSPALLASGLDGIANQHRAAADASTATSTPRSELPHVPRTLARGDRRCSPRARSPSDAFGDDVVEHYAHFFRTEQAALRRAPSPTGSGRRYFERI